MAKPQEDIKCPQCSNQAKITNEDGRYFVYCVTCGLHTYLKTICQIGAQTDSKLMVQQTMLLNS